MLDNDANPKTLSRLELLKLAQTLRVSDADVMTRAELRAAIERAKRPDPRPPAQPATWLGVARRLLASIVEQGLHLPEAAALIRGDAPVRPYYSSGPPPVATVTLARIYAAQGHLERAIGTLDEVLQSDPDHDLARQLQTQLAASLAEKRERERQERAAAEPVRAVRAAEAAGGEDDITLSGGAEPLRQVEPPSPPEAPKPEPTPIRLEPPSADAPPSVAEPSVSEPAAAARESARPAGLVLIETNEPGTYVYWELAIPAAQSNGNGPEPYWLSVVTHAPRDAGSERRERSFPVQRNAGAVRLEGLPPHGVVRAKLTRGDPAEAPPVVVAGAVRATAALTEAYYLPHPGADPGALAARAGEHLASAAPIYY